MASSNRFRTTATGALPGRNPGSRARLAYIAHGLVLGLLDPVDGTVTWRDLEAASSDFFSMVMLDMGQR